MRINSHHTVVSDLVTANLVQDTLNSVSLPPLNPQWEFLIPTQILGHQHSLRTLLVFFLKIP